jgi:hypothetical protein
MPSEIIGRLAYASDFLHPTFRVYLFAFHADPVDIIVPYA